MGSWPGDPLGEPLRLGFSVRDVHRAAAAAVKSSFYTSGLEAEERFDVAWCAVVERLYDLRTPGPPPGFSDLLVAGMAALHAFHRDHLHTQGIPRDRRAEGAANLMPGYVRYWMGITEAGCPEPRFVASVIDRLALCQIFPHLSKEQRETLLALALHRSIGRAAAATGTNVETFKTRLTRARSRFLALWFEHETPRAVAPAPGKRADTSTEWRRLRPAIAAVLKERELPAVVLPDCQHVFGQAGAEVIHAGDLLVGLRGVRPAVYGRWDTRDLAQALRVCGVWSRYRRINGTGRGAYLRDDITTAAALHQQPAQPDDCDTVLAGLLEAERVRPGTRRFPKPDAHAGMLTFIGQAGPAGVTRAAIAQYLDE
ncbi:MAG TPA: hypothetical protein VKV80_15265 [Streptosporangiaceae bacterium]|nr:hypothetical protein [Streptosporangiaceae bacterium]